MIFEIRTYLLKPGTPPKADELFGEMYPNRAKLSRIAGYFARRWQNQERTAHLIAEFIEKTVEPLGVAVLIEGKHLCAAARGVRDTHSVMKVNVMHGVFQSDHERRAELLMRLK